jgi:hypothetical protein
MGGGRNRFSMVSVDLVLGAIENRDMKEEIILTIITRFNGECPWCVWVMIGLKNGVNIVSTVSGSMNSMVMAKKQV